MSSYNSHHLDGSYGNPGFFVARTTGTVRDSSGRTTELTPELTQRSARRLLVRTAELPPPVDGVYTAEIRPAKGTTGVKLAHIATPRPTARVRAQLTLYSIPIINSNTSSSVSQIASQRYCRNQLMSRGTSTFPFFDVFNDTTPKALWAKFDWRGPDSEVSWISASDRSSIIPPSQRHTYTNQYIDLDTLTVAVPPDCTMHELGTAFSHALKNHAGARNEKNSSLWNRYGIAVTESGFSVYEQMEESDAFNTFAVHIRPHEFDNDFSDETDPQRTGSSSYEQRMATPLTIRLNKSRSVFIAFNDNDSEVSNISGTHYNYKEFVPTTVETDVFEVSIPTPIDRTTPLGIKSISFPNDVTSENILGVYSNIGDANDEVSYNITPVSRTYQKERDVRLGLRWGDKVEGTDFLIDNNEEYESKLAFETLKNLQGEGLNLADVAMYNDLRTTSELEDTFRTRQTYMSELFSVRTQNDAHQMKDMLFAGHMMNVAAPTAMPISDNATPQAEALQRPDPDVPLSEGFYADNLGWETSIISEPSKYIMAAFPVRDTHAELSQDDDGFFKTIRTSVSPLVAKILSRLGTDGKGFYQEKNQNGEEHNRQNIDLTHFEPRLSGAHSNAIVVLIGDQNYVIKSARPVSVLRNQTRHHLDLTSYGTPEVIKSSQVRAELEHQLRTMRPVAGQSTEIFEAKVAALQQEIDDNKSSEARHFYTYEQSQGSGVDAYRAMQDAKYFTWVFELDRPVQLQAAQQTVSNGFLLRSFAGLTDPASMFVPGAYHEDSGRAAPYTVQQAAHSFFVRNGAGAEDQMLLILHGIGSVERPLNSTASGRPEGIFTILNAEPDHKKPLQSACESSVWMRPQTLHSLQFSFASSKTGEKLTLKDNATLLFDLYCENE